jgi:hypothetical protein
MAPDVVLITSVLNTGTHKWSYTNTRSVFTCEERFEQSRKSIQSVRTQMPHAKVLYVECSNIPEAMEATLKQESDFYLQLYENDSIRNVCLASEK